MAFSQQRASPLQLLQLLLSGLELLHVGLLRRGKLPILLCHLLRLLLRLLRLLLRLLRKEDRWRD